MSASTVDAAGLTAALRSSVATRTRKWLVAIALLIGLLVAAAMAVGSPAEDRTFATFAGAIVSLISVVVPFIGALLGHDLRAADRPAPVAPTLLAATLVAVAAGVYGVLLSALTLAVAGPSSAENPWQFAGTIVVGSVLVQVVAQLIGTGLGMLLRSAVVAGLGTIVLPLGLYLLLGVVDALQAFTPFATVQNLLSGDMTAANWAQWVAVLIIWGGGLNAAGIARLRRR